MVARMSVEPEEAWQHMMVLVAGRAVGYKPVHNKQQITWFLAFVHVPS